MQRLLEGELFVHRGIVYVVKGFQHPESFVVAYPRYNLISKRKLLRHEQEIYMSTIYWDCIKQKIPIIPLNDSSPYTVRDTPQLVSSLRNLLESIFEKDIYLSGSASVLTEYNDVDLIVYGADESTVNKLRKIHSVGILERPLYALIREHSEKHAKTLDLVDYLYLKRNTLLHALYKGIHLNFKLIEMDVGSQGCVEPVKTVYHYTGMIEVIKPLNPHLIPARYYSRMNGEEVILESLREMYAELPSGLYYIENARVEERKHGVVVNPDHGYLRPLHYS